MTSLGKALNGDGVYATLALLDVLDPQFPQSQVVQSRWAKTKKRKHVDSTYKMSTPFLVCLFNSPALHSEPEMPKC